MAARVLFGSEFEAVELNEPAYLAAWPSTVLYHATLRIARAVGRGPRLAAAYCIENGAIAERLAHRLGVPLGLARLVVRRVVRFQLGNLDRVVFGTDSAKVAYLEAAGFRMPVRTEWCVIPALPSACACAGSSNPRHVLFLGAFESHKGVRELMRAWPNVANGSPGSRLVLAGKGSLEAEVHTWAAQRSDVDVVIDPSRDECHRLLRDAKVAVLLSQRTDTWREQVGLPITEGLAHGCEVVTSSETGLADWLSCNGHQVLPPDAGEAEVSGAIQDALSSIRTAAELIGSLPASDGRLAADHWMFR